MVELKDALYGFIEREKRRRPAARGKVRTLLENQLGRSKRCFQPFPAGRFRAL